MSLLHLRTKNYHDITALLMGGPVDIHADPESARVFCQPLL